MDRYTSCGKTRPPVLHVEDTQCQLPCSEAAFKDGREVKTRWLSETDDAYAERREKSRADGNDKVVWEVGADEAEIDLYIRAVDHFGNVMKWAVPGGCR